MTAKRLIGPLHVEEVGLAVLDVTRIARCVEHLPRIVPSPVTVTSIAQPQWSDAPMRAEPGSLRSG